MRTRGGCSEKSLDSTTLRALGRNLIPRSSVYCQTHVLTFMIVLSLTVRDLGNDLSTTGRGAGIPYAVFQIIILTQIKLVLPDHTYLRDENC